MEVDNPAGLLVRFFANLLDGIFLFIVLGFLSLVLYGQFSIDSFTILDIINLLYIVLLPVFWYGYTLGKRALGIRITKVDGEPVGIGTMLLRELVGGIIYTITLGIAVIISAFMVGLREDKRAIHDFISGTYVTYDPPEKKLIR